MGEGDGNDEAEKPNAAAVVVGGLMGGLLRTTGPAFTVLFGSIFLLWMSGDAPTENEFVRRLFFGEVTRGGVAWPLQAFFILLIVLVLLRGARVIRSSKSAENAELKRVADERTKWQDDALSKTARVNQLEKYLFEKGVPVPPAPEPARVSRTEMVISSKPAKKKPKKKGD